MIRRGNGGFIRQPLPMQMEPARMLVEAKMPGQTLGPAIIPRTSPIAGTTTAETHFVIECACSICYARIVPKRIENDDHSQQRFGINRQKVAP
jgi:hypothetical protein